MKTESNERVIAELADAVKEVIHQAKVNGLDKLDGDSGYDFRDALEKASSALAAYERAK